MTGLIQLANKNILKLTGYKKVGRKKFGWPAIWYFVSFASLVAGAGALFVFSYYLAGWDFGCKRLWSF